MTPINMSSAQPATHDSTIMQQTIHDGFYVYTQSCNKQLVIVSMYTHNVHYPLFFFFIHVGTPTSPPSSLEVFSPSSIHSPSLRLRQSATTLSLPLRYSTTKSNSVSLSAQLYRRLLCLLGYGYKVDGCHVRILFPTRSSRCHQFFLLDSLSYR